MTSGFLFSRFFVRAVPGIADTTRLRLPSSYNTAPVAVSCRLE